MAAAEESHPAEVLDKARQIVLDSLKDHQALEIHWREIKGEND